MSGVVVEVRVKEAQEIKKGDPIAGTCTPFIGAVLRQFSYRPVFFFLLVMSAMKVCSQCRTTVYDHLTNFRCRWSPPSLRPCLVISSVSLFMKVCGVSCVSGIRDLIYCALTGDSINQGDLVVEIVH